MNKETLKKLIAVATGREPTDLLICNGKIADVYSGRFFEGEIAVSCGLIAATGKNGTYSGTTTIDAKGQYVLPGFIDSHIHIESSFLSPPELAKLILPRGTTTIIADAHEIVNVAGLEGLNYMLESSKALALDVKFMLPSCVPCTPYEHSGAVLEAPALEKSLRLDRVLGLGEMMNYPGVINCDDVVLDKIILALEQGKLIDGHSPGLDGRELAAYMAGMIRTDHECSTIEEMNRRIEAGMYVMLRQGSACHDLLNLLLGVTAQNSLRCLLCADDLQPKSIFEAGHIENSLRLCVRYGLDPMLALRMATLNAAECFGLKDRGGFAPGLRADMVVANNPQDLRISQVFVKGVCTAEEGRIAHNTRRRQADDSVLRNSIHVKDFSVKKLAMRLESDEAWVIDVSPDTAVTGKVRVKAKTDLSRNFLFDPAADIAKIAVVERHQNTGNVGIGLIRGYGIRCGAVALSVAHDSHNIIVTGTNDADMDQSGEWVDRKLTSLQEKAVAVPGVNKKLEPLMTLCFMSLPVIPKLKITDMGLFDTATFSFIRIAADS